MRNIEDDIGQVMAGHDEEAPGAADLLRALQRAPGPRRRRGRRFWAGWYVPLAAAAAVAAVVVGSVWAGGFLGGHRQALPTAHGQAGRVGQLSCPARYAGQAPWVPAKPAGVDGRSRLVPPKDAQLGRAGRQPAGAHRDRAGPDRAVRGPPPWTSGSPSGL